MITTRVFRLGVMSALTACIVTPTPGAAAPVLRSADVRITITSPTTCLVSMMLTVEGASEIDHRLDASTAASGVPFSPPNGFGGHASVVELLVVLGAQRVGALRTIGRTQSLVLRPDNLSYEFSYRALQPADRLHRCPIWLPAVPTDGQARAVRLQVDLPPAAFHGSSMPAFSWTGGHGSTTLGSLPAFVHVSYGSDGESPGWSIGQVMDAAAVAVFAGASAIWVWRRRR